MKLSIGPIQYYWERAAVEEFYVRIADSAADVVYLGEVVCSKRREMSFEDWLAIGRDLAQNGKEVVLSTLTLLEAATELSALRRLCGNDAFMVEANDMSAVQLLCAAGRPFITGPAVNIYNDHSLGLLARKGLRRWVLPLELDLGTLNAMQATTS